MIILIAIIFVILFLLLKLNSAKIKGAIGETKVNTRLKFLSSGYISLHDVLIPNSKGSTSQIDHIVLSEYGIFVIETKKYKGWIFGNEKAENWMQVIYKEKHQFRNPVKQNWGHVYALKALLKDFPNAKYYPIVVFSGSATLKEIESSIPVIYENSLNRTIRNYSVEKCLSPEEILQIQKLLESAEITERDARNGHIQNIQDEVSERQSKIDRMICPRCM